MRLTRDKNSRVGVEPLPLRNNVTDPTVVTSLKKDTLIARRDSALRMIFTAAFGLALLGLADAYQNIHSHLHHSKDSKNKRVTFNAASQLVDVSGVSDQSVSDRDNQRN